MKLDMYCTTSDGVRPCCDSELSRLQASHVVFSSCEGKVTWYRTFSILFEAGVESWGGQPEHPLPQ